MKCSFISTLLLLAFVISSLQSYAQPLPVGTSSKDTIPNDIFGGLKFRSIGPAIASGRIVDFAVNPKDHSQYFVAVGCGGVWKTINDVLHGILYLKMKNLFLLVALRLIRIIRMWFG